MRRGTKGACAPYFHRLRSSLRGAVARQAQHRCDQVARCAAAVVHRTSRTTASPRSDAGAVCEGAPCRWQERDHHTEERVLFLPGNGVGRARVLGQHRDQRRQAFRPRPPVGIAVRTSRPIQDRAHDFKTAVDRLPAHLARMALFAINTGLRESNVCGLQWDWEGPVPEVGRSVFVIPPEAFKTKRAHVAILNDVAWSIIETQRGKHPIWVFPYRGRRIGKMNNNGWQQARYEPGLTQVRVHDLRHSCACRLRAAGVSAEDREALSWPRQSFDGRSLRKCRRRPSRQASESHTQSKRNADRVTRRGRSPQRDRGSPTATRRTWFCAPSA